MEAATQVWRELNVPLAVLIEIAEKYLDTADDQSPYSLTTAIAVPRALGIACLVDAVARQCKRSKRRDEALLELTHRAARLLLRLVNSNDAAAQCVAESYAPVVRRVLALCTTCSACTRAGDGATAPCPCQCPPPGSTECALALMARLVPLHSSLGTVIDDGSPTIRHSIGKLSAFVLEQQPPHVSAVIAQIRAAPRVAPSNIASALNNPRPSPSSTAPASRNSPAVRAASSPVVGEGASLLGLLGLLQPRDKSPKLALRLVRPLQSTEARRSGSRAKSTKPLPNRDSLDSSLSSSCSSSPRFSPLSTQNTAAASPAGAGCWLPRYSPTLTAFQLGHSHAQSQASIHLVSSHTHTHPHTSTAHSTLIGSTRAVDAEEFKLTPGDSSQHHQCMSTHALNSTAVTGHDEAAGSVASTDNATMYEIEVVSSSSGRTALARSLSVRTEGDLSFDFPSALPVVSSPLHARLSSPERRKFSTLSPSEAASLLEARHAKAAALRDASIVRTVEKLQRSASKTKAAARAEAELLRQSQERKELDDRLSAAAASHEESVEAKRRRAESENVKVAEVLFIKSLEAARSHDRKLAIERKLSETERRRQQRQAQKLAAAAELQRKQEQIKAKQREANQEAQIIRAKIDSKLHAAEQRRRQQLQASHSHKASLTQALSPHLIHSRSAHGDEDTPQSRTATPKRPPRLVRPASSPAKTGGLPLALALSHALIDRGKSMRSIQFDPHDECSTTVTIEQLRALPRNPADELFSPPANTTSTFPSMAALAPDSRGFCGACGAVLEDASAVTAHTAASPACSEIVPYDSRVHGRALVSAPSKSSRRNQKKKANKLKARMTREQEIPKLADELIALAQDTEAAASLLYKPCTALLTQLAEVAAEAEAETETVEAASITSRISSAEWLATLLVRTQTMRNALAQPLSHGESSPAVILGATLRATLGTGLTLPLPTDALTAIANLALDCLRHGNADAQTRVLSQARGAIPKLIAIATGTLTQAIVTAPKPRHAANARVPLIDARPPSQLPILIELVAAALRIAAVNTALSSCVHDWLQLAAVYGLIHRTAQLLVASQPCILDAACESDAVRFDRDHVEVALALLHLVHEIVRIPNLPSTPQLALQATGIAGVCHVTAAAAKAVARRARGSEVPLPVRALVQHGCTILADAMRDAERARTLLQQQLTHIRAAVRFAAEADASLVPCPTTIASGGCGQSQSALSASLGALSLALGHVCDAGCPISARDILDEGEPSLRATLQQLQQRQCSQTADTDASRLLDAVLAPGPAPKPSPVP